jgi:Cof subfamily protein (haloacid dehalogenase superfamily)
MQHYSVLVSDIDGTLLDQHGRLPAANIIALRHWLDQGRQLVLATGRNLAITRPIAQAIDRAFYLILQDGCLLMHYPSLEILAYHNLSAAVAELACEIFRREQHSIMLFDPLPHGQSFTLQDHGPHSSGLATYLQGKIGQFQSFTDYAQPVGTPSKIVTLDDEHTIEYLFQTMTTSLPEARVLRTEAVRLRAWFIEIGASAASKVQALQTLLTYLGTNLEETIAVGDAENDIEMIQAAGLGIAMGNASERVKAVANRVIGSNQTNGLADFLAAIMVKPSYPPQPFTHTPN